MSDGRIPVVPPGQRRRSRQAPTGRQSTLRESQRLLSDYCRVPLGSDFMSV